MDSQNDSLCFEPDIVNKTCFKFSKHDYSAVLWTNNSVAILAALLCIMTIGIIVFQKAYEEFVHRLALYLSITSFIVSFINLIRVAATEQRCEHLQVKYNGFCIAMGFFLEYSALVLLLFLSWVTFHIFMMAAFKKNYFESCRNEKICLIIATVAPALISCIPFFSFNGNGIMYGLAVPWCWIRSTDENCTTYKEGFIEQLVLFYGPLVLLILFNFVVMVVAVIVFCKGTKMNHRFAMQEKYKKALKETWPLLLYPVIFNIIFCLTLGPRIYYNITQNSILGLWVIHTMALPLLFLFIPLAFILHPTTLKKFSCRQLHIAASQWRHSSLRSHTHFVVSKEDSSDTLNLVIEGVQGRETYNTFLVQDLQ